ncbi:pilus assembly protein PilP [Thalassomonas viridans]|uniref:Pilus assembly protein PilP n=1 Tax=Thalassomonas viridans TaxID=137584 RepID=A0AAE9Z0U9_9GAMM|nr:pilus assembly protein PilP [Thalassomonas viridans]WDE04751.1 pilus assembly protein PilP [Thalassomonas viridans]
MIKYLVLLPALLLSGCFDDPSELKAFMAKVQADTGNEIEPMPAVPKFNHFDYSAQSERSPFVAPEPEAIQEKLQQMTGCLSPDPRRRKQPLEKYSLADLSMRGTLGELGITWALVQASDASLHRVAVGGYMGLYHGRITQVTQESVTVVELIPDGAGCWLERESVVSIVESEG